MSCVRISLLIFSLLINSVYGQLSKADLVRQWNDKSLHDTIRVDAADELARNVYLFTRPDSAIYYAELQYVLAESISEYDFMAASMATRGIANCITGRMDVGKSFFLKSADLFIKAESPDGVSGAMSNLGNVYQQEGKTDSAIYYYSLSLKIGDKYGLTSSDHTIINIGLLYSGQEDYETAKSYFFRALRINEGEGNSRGIANVYNNLGGTYSKLGMYDSSMYYFLKSKETYEQMDDLWGVGDVLNNLASLIERDEGNIDSALACYQRSLEIRTQFNDREGMALTLRNMGGIYREQGQYDKALELTKKALKIAEEIKSPRMIRGCSETLFKTYKKKNDFDKALFYYEQYVKFNDSLVNLDNQKKVIRQEFEYEYEKQAAADSIHTAERVKLKDAELAKKQAENASQKQQSYFLYAGLGIALLFGGFIFNRFRITRHQKEIINEQKKKVDVAFGQLEEKNQEIMDSISYAKRIQSAILPPAKLVREYLPDSFILYKPKDIVAGDFYWLEHKDDKILFAAADCTGHGVPGAMVSVVCVNGLNRSVREQGIVDPGKILDATREIVIAEFEKSEEDVKDGMDIALCSLTSEGLQSLDNNGTALLQYAGAHNPLWIIRKGKSEIEEIKADKQPIGKFGQARPFTTHSIQLEKGDAFYIFTDGFADQFGGEKGKKFKAANFKKLLLSIQDQSMNQQHQIIDEAVEKWRGTLEQVDDICVIGVRI